jgi:hypothetical protein
VTTITKHASAFRRCRDSYPNSGDTSYCEVGNFSDRESLFFLLFDAINDEIPAGSHIDSATLCLVQITGGYTGTITLDVSFRGSVTFSGITWNNQPADAGAGHKYPSLYAYTGGTRTVDIKTLAQWLIDHNNAAPIIRVARSSGGSADGKQFSTTASDHYFVVNYTAPPAKPTNVVATRVYNTQVDVSCGAASGATSYNWLRSTDGGAFVQVATGTATPSFSDTTTEANHTYIYKAVSANSAGTTTSDPSSAVYTTPAIPTMGIVVKTGASSATINLTDNARSNQYLQLRRRTNGGAWGDVSATIPAGSASYTDNSVPAGTIEYQAQALRGALVSGYSATSNAITTSCAPAAPTLTAWPAYSPTGTVLRVYVQHNSLDGSAQTKMYITYTKDGAQTTYEYTGTDAHYDIPITGLAATKVVTVKAKTMGLYNGYGPDSAVQSTTMAALPTVAITSPAADGATVTTLPLTVGFSYSNAYVQASWVMSLYAGDGMLIHAWAGTTETSQAIPRTYLSDDASYSIELVVTASTGFSCAAVIRLFSTDYVSPTAPSASATFDPIALAVSIIATAGETGALPATDHLELVRIDSFEGDTSTDVLTALLPQSTVYMDPVPRLGQASVKYQILAVAASGVFSYLEVEVDTSGLGVAALNYSSGLASMIPLQWDGSESEKSRDDSEAYQFEGREKPVLYEGSHSLESLSVSATLMDDEYRTALRQLRKNRARCVYRSAYGLREFVKVDDIGADRGGDSDDVSGVQLSMTVVE